VEAASQEAVLQAGIELLPSRTREAIREAQRTGSPFNDSATAIVAGDRKRLQIHDMPIQDGTIGCAIDVSEVDKVREQLTRAVETNARTLDHLTAGIASFDREGVLLFHNKAFRAIWDLSPEWLATSPRRAPSSTSCAPTANCPNRRITATGAPSTSRRIASARRMRIGGTSRTGARFASSPCPTPSAA
jgi:PAS domain-containing protein